MPPAAPRAARRQDQTPVRDFGPVIESLESRRLLATAAALVDGVITWTGGPEANKLVAVMKAKTVVVRTDGVVVEFPLGKVLGLLADGGEGDDRILIDQTKSKFLLRTTMFGGAGNDEIVGGDGRDVIRGGLGLDSLVANGGKDNVSGNEEADTIAGGDGDDKLTGGDGDDSLLGGAGNDRVFGDGGNDYLRGDDGADTIDAGDGDDRVSGGSQSDVIDGGLGSDSLSGSGGDDVINGGDGDDKLQGDNGNDNLAGGAGIDLIYGRSASSDADEDGWGGARDDNDQIDGGDDGDVIYAGGGDDLVLGGVGDDVIFGGFGWDDLSGGYGNDTIHGEAGEDFLFGQLGMDLLLGGDDRDQLDGGADGDAVFGGRGNDVLFGGGGDDSLAGEAGDDYLDGETGSDSLAGGAGADTFAGVGPEDLTDKNETDPGGQANLVPTLASVSSSVNPAVVGDPFILTANGATDLDGFVVAVRFYRESNGVAGLQAWPEGGDTLIAVDADPSDGWRTVIQTGGTEPGEFAYHAQATDNGLSVSDAASTIVTVEMPLNTRPTIGALVATPTPVGIGSPLTLIAQNVTDANGSVRAVTFYEETNGIAGLQSGAGGDTLLGAGTRNGANWTRTVGTTGRQAGWYAFYAVATDNGYSSSTVASTVASIV